MSFATKALMQQLRICTRAALTSEEVADCAYWKEVISRGEREQQSQLAVNFATGPAPQEPAQPEGGS